MVINQAQIDKAKNKKALNELFTGLELMMPEMVVIIGEFTSQEAQDSDNYNLLRANFDNIGKLIRDKDLHCLREKTSWVIMPSTSDAGVMKIMPSFKMSDFLLEGFRGKGVNKIRNVEMATNPMRVSFKGKEIAFCRYNYFKKIKRNCIEKLQI